MPVRLESLTYGLANLSSTFEIHTMPDKLVDLETIHYRRVFPWLHLFRAFWIAIDPRKLLLATVALVVLSSAEVGLQQLLTSPAEMSSPVTPTRPWPWQETLGYKLEHKRPLAEIQASLHDPWSFFRNVTSNWQLVLRPVLDLTEPAAKLFRAHATWPDFAWAVSQFLLQLGVWALFGGAICRMAAMQFARDQQVGLWKSLRFSGSFLLSYLTGPLLPLLGVFLLWGVCAAGGLLGRIPVAGEFVVGVLWGLGLLASLLMALILLGLAAGWPLMYATVSVEAFDGFDGLQRGYNYVFERPWHYLGLGLVTMVHGSIVTFFVWLMGQLVVSLTAWAAGSGLGMEAAARAMSDVPTLVAAASNAPPDNSWIALFVAGWTRLVAALVVGFVYSYFWTAATIIYFLLRRSVDGNELDEIYVQDEEVKDDLLPLVGTAATPLPIVDTPAKS